MERKEHLGPCAHPVGSTLLAIAKAIPASCLANGADPDVLADFGNVMSVFNTALREPCA